MNVEQINQQIDAYIRHFRLFRFLTKDDLEDFRQEVFVAAIEKELNEIDFKLIRKVYKKFIRNLKRKWKYETSLDLMIEKEDDILEG